MPQIRYMELDSNYRNRTEFENQASFEVGISGNGMRTNTSALDPVTNAYPEIVFQPANFATTTLTITNSSGIPASSSYYTFIMTGDANTVLVQSYYIGAVLRETISVTDVNSVVTTTVQLYRITGWDIINITNKIVKVTTDIPISSITTITPPPSPPSSQITFEIINPTHLTYGYVFIPTSRSIDNYYNKYVLWNQNKNRSVPILGFDGTTHLAQLGGDISDFLPAHTYVVRKENPIGTGVLAISKYFNPPTAINNWFEISQTVSPGLINGFVRIYETSASPIGTSTKVQNPNANIIAKIIRIEPFENEPNPKLKPTIPINTIVVSSVPDDVNTNPTDYTYELMGFTIDNYSPFVYNGTLSSQNQPVAHEITLNSLVLPNVPLKSGGRIAYYPYVYVELENLSATTKSNNNIILSNNPHTYKAIFKVPITDLNHPSISPFVKLTGNGMTQTMTFKQNDNMRVSVKLPSGELFQTIQQDTSFGQAPIPFIQISLCFGIQRV